MSTPFKLKSGNKPSPVKFFGAIFNPSRSSGMFKGGANPFATSSLATARSGAGGGTAGKAWRSRKRAGTPRA